MESKSNDEMIEYDSKGEVKKLPNLVLRFCEFAFKILNHDMDTFFVEHMELFDQDENELQSGGGETLQQYEVYQKYLKELDILFDEFAFREGFSSSSNCFDAINDSIQEDKEGRKKYMKELTAKMREAHELMIAQRKRAHEDEDKSQPKIERVDDGDKKSDDTDNITNAEIEEMPTLLFFQPMSMESMLQQVLTLTEYQTFSFVMRAKCRQLRLLHSMEKKVTRHRKSNDERETLLAHLTTRNLMSVFEDTITRICDLTPTNKELNNVTRSIISLQDIEVILDAQDNRYESKEGHHNQQDAFRVLNSRRLLFKKITLNTCMTLWQLCSQEQRLLIRAKLSSFISDIAQVTEDDIPASMKLYLVLINEMIDSIELHIVDVLSKQLQTSKKGGHHGTSSEAKESSRNDHSDRKGSK